MTAEHRKWLRLRWPLIVLLCVVLVGATLGARVLARSSASAGSNADAATFRVRRGPLTISVVEAGTIQALEQEIIKSEVEGQSTIIYLIPEGTLVEEGELLVELEAGRLQDDLVEQQIRVQNAEASFIRTRENLAVAKNQSTSDIAKAELDYSFAQEDVVQYVEGEHPQELREAESRITLAQEELERAAEKLKWSKKLHEEKYISQTEYEADRIAHKRAELDHELAQASLKLLREYTAKRMLAQLESDVTQAEMALERVKLRAGADIVQAEADLKATESEFRQQKSKLAKVNRQIAKTKIIAPRAGLVVYATSARSSWRGNDDPLDEGQSVRERQELIYLPTADALMAHIQIHESNLDKIRLGLPVRVTVDAMKEKTFTGRVAKIAPLPNAHSMRMNPDLKVYLTEVHIDGKHRELRTGMSCKAEVFIEQHDEAIYVPVQTVVRIGDQHTVYVRGVNDVEKKPVEIGLDNNRMVRIVSGLTEGEEVLLTPPLEEAATVTEDQLASGADTEQIKKSIEEAKRAAAAGPRRGPPAGEARRDGEGVASPPGMGGRHGPETGRRGPGQPGRDRSTDGERRGRGFGNMSKEQIEAMRKRFENMSPEEREAMRQRGQQMRQQGGSRDRGRPE